MTARFAPANGYAPIVAGDVYRCRWSERREVVQEANETTGMVRLWGDWLPAYWLRARYVLVHGAQMERSADSCSWSL